MPSLAKLYAPTSNTAVVPPARRADYYSPYGPAYEGSAYDAAATGRRLSGWNPVRTGPTTTLWATRDLIVARCRDEVRNNPWAASAVDNFESQVVGNGVKPKWNLKSEELKLAIEQEFYYSAVVGRNMDVDGLCDFYGLQALACREIFEGGEVFLRRFIRPKNWQPRLRVPLQIQLMETEQLPIFLNVNATGGLPQMPPPGMVEGNTVRTGIEFDQNRRRVAYFFYREHPGETMFYPQTALQFDRIPAEDVLHVYKPMRAGLLRGQPHLSSALVLLHELEKYTDAAVVKKQIQTMFAGFICKTSPDGSDVLPPDPNGGVGMNLPGYVTDPMTRNSHLEPGSLQLLYPGEDIKFPALPQDSDMSIFMTTILHEFAVAVGATYEQITGDLRGVNLSSIRAGVLDFRRKCEQFIFNVVVAQFCQQVIRWWLDAAMLAGRLRLPGYATEPEQYLDITWNTTGWPWLDPLKDVQAKQMEVRSGFTSRMAVCAEKGEDAALIDQQQVADNQRADALDLIYDIDPRKILVGKEANPQVEEEGEPEAQDLEDDGQPGDGQPGRKAVNQ